MPVTTVQPSLTFTKSPSAQSKKSQALVLEALERLQHKSPGRQNSYSDSTDGDEEVEEAFAAEHSRQSWERSVYRKPSGTLGLGEYDGTEQPEDIVHSAFYSSKLSMSRSDLSKGYAVSALVAVLHRHSSSELSLISSNLCFISSPPSSVGADLESVPASAPSPDPLPPPLPLPLNLTMSSNGQEMEDFVPVSTEEGALMSREMKRVSPVTENHLCCQEVELKVSLVKSDKGSLGFTLTKGNDHGCYIHDIVQDPAKGDGRLRAGDRMIMVGVYPCSFCSRPQT